jgi:mono/diheme cytochrome c family protein
MSPRLAAAALALCALAAAAAGCSRHGVRRGPQTGATAVPSADLNRGKTVFETQCAACHGQRGIGGPIGPALHNEYRRRSYASVYAIVADPAPPMPKLYPSRISKGDLRDVSAYVESL